MRLSFEQARLLNIDEDIIRRAEQWGMSLEDAARIESDKAPTIQPSRPERPRPADGFDSKLERDFSEVLKRAERSDLIQGWWHHPCGFRLAPKCYFHPDFLVQPGWMEDFRAVFVEVKGGWFRDDAKVKIKVAAELFPCFRWLLVTREKRNLWEAREVDHRGIGTSPIHVPWLCNL